jgi:Fe2+ or Zn2+ uptake regulation protein
VKNKEKIEKILKENGFKNTETRFLLLDLLLSSKKTHNVKKIVEKLCHKNIDNVTIYRTLESFTEKGIIRKVEMGTREAQYEMVDHKDDHHHIVCLKCKKTEDFTGCEAQKLVSKILEKNKNFKNISHHSFDLFGVCNNCTNK